MPRRKETITLSIPSGTKEQLEEIARKLGIFWGQSPSTSGLLAAIAEQKYEVGKPFTLNRAQVDALMQAIKLLTDSGLIEQAQTLSSFVLERGNLEPPTRQLLLQQVSQPTQAWRILIEQLRQNQQPFHLLYCNSQGQELVFTVRYAEITFAEKNFYLNIWCDETENTKETKFPELRHNRCLRLDRVRSLVPINGQWRHQGLDFLDVYLHFRGEMIKGYKPRQYDISDEVMEELREVVRRVDNPSWLVREVLRYGGDCVVVSPDCVRSLIREKLESMYQDHDLDISS